MKMLDTTTRIQLRNVLFLSDFSPAANAAIPYAAEVAKRFGAKVFALHMRTPVVNPMTEPATWAGLEEAAEAEAKASAKLCASRSQDSNRKCSLRKATFIPRCSTSSKKARLI